MLHAPHTDDRGFFMRSYDVDVFAEAGLHFTWVQENHSRTACKATLRGLHFQLPPFSETKLIRCIRGRIFDVWVDLRMGSPTFGKWDSKVLDEEVPESVLLPRGIAHGFCSLTDECHILYKHDNYYNPDYYRGIRWNDTELRIRWPFKKVFLSDQDSHLMSLKNFKKTVGGILVE